MRLKKQVGFCLLIIVAAFLLAGAPGFGQVRKEVKPAVKADAFDYAAVIKQLKARNIGPANMGGRTVDFAVPERNTSIIYAAVGPSGLWKTEDAGITWSPSFHMEATVM